MESRLVRVSRFLSLVLRHDPSAAGVELDAEGWTEVDALIAGVNAAGRHLTAEDLATIVRENDKHRFELEGGRIRARQGHSVQVDLGLSASSPPKVLFHGTAERVEQVIRVEGLRQMGRTRVHLSADEGTAARVGRRHGRPVVLRVDAAAMVEAGMSFYLSSNGVWLTEAVPPEFITALPRRGR